MKKISYITIKYSISINEFSRNIPNPINLTND